jgi:Do/DeqQ family serine protease
MRRIALTVLAALSLLSCNRERIEPQRSSPAASTPIVSSGGQQSFADIVDRVAPAVVTIRSERRARAPQQFPFFSDPMLREFFGLGRGGQPPPRSQVQRGLGSGVVVSEDGYILTNHHVIDGAQEIKVEFAEGKTYSARLVGSDAPSDLAVLKVSGDKFPVLPLGDSDKVRVGDVVLAVGNPLGVGQTVTSGIISAKGRQTGLSDGSFEDFLQTDAAINRGNSGGALVNTRGELIGINSQILSPTGVNIGIGFSIPSNMAREVRDQLIKRGNVRRGQLGVYPQAVTAELATGLGLKDTKGVLIADVDPNGAAARAGIQRGDLILKINNDEVNNPNALRNRIARTDPGTAVTVTLLRNGKEQQVEVKLGELRAANQGPDRGNEPGGEESGGRLGVSVQPLTPEIARQLGLRSGVTGLVVRDVAPDGPAAEAGIQPGDVIVEANRQAVPSNSELQRILSKGGPVVLLMNRQGRTFFVTLRS